MAQAQAPTQEGEGLMCCEFYHPCRCHGAKSAGECIDCGLSVGLNPVPHGLCPICYLNRREKADAEL